jgi:predicted dehydrogenase
MRFRWAIFGTGEVSAKFAKGLSTVANASVAVVASREQDRAEQFVARLGTGRAIAGYDPTPLVGQVDAVYLATPTGLHARHAMACLEAGLPVLVEKPLAATVAETQALIALARQKQLFLMEGLWTRFLPAARALQEATLQLGELRLLTGGFAIANAPDPSRPLFQPNLGGGAMRQYGVYPLALGQLIAGPAESIHATGTLGATGVEGSVAMTVRYQSGPVGNFYASLETTGDNSFTIHGTRGRAGLTGPIFRPAGVRKVFFTPRVRPAGGSRGLAAKLQNSAMGQRLMQMIQHRRGLAGRAVAYPFSGNGYNLEAAEAQRCIASKLVESPLMPLDQSLELVRLVETALQQIGVRV